MEYLAYMQKRIKEESDRVNTYLDPSTGPRLQSVLEETLIGNHIDTLKGPGFISLAENGATSQLAQLFEAVKRVGKIVELKTSWAEYIQQKGKSFFQGEKNSEKTVEQLIDFKKKMDIILDVSFEKDQLFRLSLKSSFEEFLNANANRSAEYLAKYLDMYMNSDALRKVKIQKEEDIKAIIDNCIPIFKFILNKDIFEAFYLKRLCKRLLFNKIVSSDCEKYLLDKLREECGSGYTRKAEAMFQDIQITEELSSGFAKFLLDSGNAQPQCQFSASVLTLGSWPFESFVPVEPPQEVNNNNNSHRYLPCRSNLKFFIVHQTQKSVFIGVFIIALPLSWECLKKYNYSLLQKLGVYNRSFWITSFNITAI
jgi:cullin-4